MRQFPTVGTEKLALDVHPSKLIPIPGNPKEEIVSKNRIRFITLTKICISLTLVKILRFNDVSD